MADVQELLEPIRAIHDRVRDAVVSACERRDVAELSGVDRDAASDTIYSIDVVSEETIRNLFEGLRRQHRFVLIGEGLEDDSQSDVAAEWRIIVDPIDGTRGLMYQKRSAWILTGVAPNRGSKTSLDDIVLAVQTEIPLVKQHLADQLWTLRGEEMQAQRYNRVTGSYEHLTLHPSRADTIAHGFATVVRFFPGAREVLAAIDDEVAQALAPSTPGKASTFEDQYASTAGELYELMAGHDRFIADLRAVVSAGLCCHPYDLSAALIAEAAGVILTDPGGAPLDAPFDVTTDVSWIGYANERLRVKIEPVLQAALRRRGLLPS